MVASYSATEKRNTGAEVDRSLTCFFENINLRVTSGQTVSVALQIFLEVAIHPLQFFLGAQEGPVGGIVERILEGARNQTVRPGDSPTILESSRKFEPGFFQSRNWRGAARFH